MAGIGPAIKTTGISGGTNNSAKPGSLGANKNGKNTTAKMSMSDVNDAKDKIENGEDTGEVASTDEEKNTGETTAKTNTDDAAKKAAQSKNSVFDRMEEWKAKAKELAAENEGKIAEAQQAGAQAQANKQAEEMAKMAAMQGQQKAPSASAPKGSSPSSSKKPSSSNTDAIKKLNEARENDKKQFKEATEKQNDQLKKLATALKEEKTKGSSKTEKSDTDRIREEAKKLIAEKEKTSPAKDSARSETSGKPLDASKKALSLEKVERLEEITKDAKTDKLTPSDRKEFLAKLDQAVETTGDPNVSNIRDDFKKFVDNEQSSSRSVDSDRVQDFSSQKELEEYGEGSFSLNEELPRTEDPSLGLDKEVEDITQDLSKDIQETIETTQENVVDDVQDEIQAQLEQEEMDRQMEEIFAEIEEEIEVE